MSPFPISPKKGSMSVSSAEKKMMLSVSERTAFTVPVYSYKVTPSPADTAYMGGSTSASCPSSALINILEGKCSSA